MTTNGGKRLALPWAMPGKPKRTLRSQARAGKLELDAAATDTAAKGRGRSR